MSDISSRVALQGMSVHAFDAGSPNVFKVSEAPEDLFQQLMQAMQVNLESRYLNMPDTTSNPTYKSYADVVVNGKTVASIDNHGYVTSDNGGSGKVRAAIAQSAEDADTPSGPGLAAARAARIAAAFGGTVVKASTALTQDQYDAIDQPGVTVDTAAMKQDPAYAQMQALMAARSEFLAQQIGQASGAA
jgi:hypothetical protein